MAKVPKKKSDLGKTIQVIEVDPTECPYREFRDQELSVEYWGLSPAAFRAAALVKASSKPSPDYVWVDEQTQPLPMSVRHYLHGWIRAEELAMNRWEADVVVFEDNKMSVMDIQLGHAQVLLRSSFCRRVLSACYMLEKTEGLSIEHTWEQFSFNFGPEGWRARYHIYSPGMKAGGGAQHRPALSKSGCYLVRLFYLGAWRCVWVSDQVPVDATDAPLLPFSPLMSHAQIKSTKHIPALVTSGVVHLWPLLLCKALLKLAAPDMNSDEDEVDAEEDYEVEDEEFKDFDVLHTLTGVMSMVFHIEDPEQIWQLLTSEVTLFNWDEDDETVTSTVKSKSTKKPSAKEPNVLKRSMVSIFLEETKNEPPYTLPGITPAHALSLIVTMTRDVPLKKPLPEPEVPLWKTYRWVDWARRHGLYEAYDCPRTRYLKVSGLMKLSCAPHLLDVQSTESITFCFKEEQQEKHQNTKDKKGGKDANKSVSVIPAVNIKEELREWIQYMAMAMWIKSINIVYFPSVFQFTSAGSSPPVRPPTKAPLNKATDMQAPKAGPLYLQIDGPENNKLRISLSMLHPRVLVNSGIPIEDYIEKAYLLLETFEWFKDVQIPKAKAYITTRGYDSVEISFQPGRHFCRVWVHSRTNWYIAMISDSTLVLGTRDMIQSAAVHECPWASKFLNALGFSFSNWIRIDRSNTDVVLMCDKEFYTSYQPDLEWDPTVAGYDKHFLHWMFRQALQSLLSKKLQHHEYHIVCVVLRHHFCDPDFGMPPKPLPPRLLREIVARDPCDCVMPEVEEVEGMEEVVEEQGPSAEGEEKTIVSPDTMTQILKLPTPPATSQVCELATEDVPCGLLKDEREKVIKKHEAATHIQAYWRGCWARMCLKKHVVVNSEIIKLLMDNAFGNVEALSGLMNEFFLMYPGAKCAYSVSSALSGVYGLQQHYGTSPMSSKCKWIPYFQGVFYCHYPVKVHFDVHSSLSHTTVAIYNNDTGIQLPQAYNAHITFDFQPNNDGYTVMGHGSVTQTQSAIHPQHSGHIQDVHWQLTVLTSIDNVFHICDNPENDLCTILPLTPASKLHLEEIFIPNRRNILGGMTISVSKIEAVSFRASATSPELDMEAILRTTNSDGEVKEIARCSGKGEICWPYMRLKSTTVNHLSKKRSASHANIPLTTKESLFNTSAKFKRKATSAGVKSKSSTKLKDSKPAPIESKIYTIEVIAPNGWPLLLDQWKRVDIIRNSLEQTKVEPPPKKGAKDKGGSAKEKKEPEKEKPVTFTVHQPLPDDAYVELECSTAIGGGAFAKRDDERDILFALARRSWDAKERGRNIRGAKIREEFLDEFLIPLPTPATKISSAQASVVESCEPIFETEAEESKDRQLTQQGPSPATVSELLETIPEEEEEAKYFTMPEQLRDKFIPLYFIPLCTKETNEDESVVVTPDIAEAAKAERHSRIESALERMRELQIFNEIFVLGRQKKRSLLLEKLGIDASWGPDLLQVLEEREEAIARELVEIAGSKKKAAGRDAVDASAGKKPPTGKKK